MTLQIVLKRYEAGLLFQGKSQATIKSYCHNLKAFFTFTQTWDVDDWQIEDYMERLLRNKIEKTTYNQIMYSIRAYCNIFGQPFPTTIRKLRIQHKQKLLPFKEDILTAIRQKDTLKEKSVLLGFYDGFLRLSELQVLKTKNIDFQHDRLRVCSGKGGKDRIVLISPSTKWMIFYYLKMREEQENPYVFAAEGTKDRYVSKHYLYSIVRSAGEAIGCPGWHPHLLRHAGATHTYEETHDLIYVSNKLGHGDIKTTQIYLTFGREHLGGYVPRNNIPLIRNNNPSVIEEKVR